MFVSYLPFASFVGRGRGGGLELPVEVDKFFAILRIESGNESRSARPKNLKNTAHIGSTTNKFNTNMKHKTYIET